MPARYISKLVPIQAERPPSRSLRRLRMRIFKGCKQENSICFLAIKVSISHKN